MPIAQTEEVDRVGLVDLDQSRSQADLCGLLGHRRPRRLRLLLTPRRPMLYDSRVPSQARGPPIRHTHIDHRGRPDAHAEPADRTTSGSLVVEVEHYRTRPIASGLTPTRSVESHWCVDPSNPPPLSQSVLGLSAEILRGEVCGIAEHRRSATRSPVGGTRWRSYCGVGRRLHAWSGDTAAVSEALSGRPTISAAMSGRSIASEAG